jgi:hypothetical protein
MGCWFLFCAKAYKSLNVEQRRTGDMKERRRKARKRWNGKSYSYERTGGKIEHDSTTDPDKKWRTLVLSIVALNKIAALQ